MSKIGQKIIELEEAGAIEFSENRGTYNAKDQDRKERPVASGTYQVTATPAGCDEGRRLFQTKDRITH